MTLLTLLAQKAPTGGGGGGNGGGGGPTPPPNWMTQLGGLTPFNYPVIPPP